MRIYLSYGSIPELESVPQAQRRQVVRAAASALAGTAEGRRQFRLFCGWCFFAAASTAVIISLVDGKQHAVLPSVIAGLVDFLSYTFVFQFQVRRLRPHIRNVLLSIGHSAKQA